MTASELMEQGIRAYTRGQLGEAERCWRDVLALDPTNARAQSYLELLVGKLVQTTATAPQPAVPLPAAAPSRPAPARSGSAAAQAPGTRADPARPRAPGPVPLPAPAGRTHVEAPSRMQAPPRVEPPPPQVEAPQAAPPLPAGADWMRPPVTLAPPLDSEAVEADEFASCWESGADEITTPITIAEPIPDSPLFPALTPVPGHAQASAERSSATLAAPPFDRWPTVKQDERVGWAAAAARPTPATTEPTGATPLLPTPVLEEPAASLRPERSTLSDYAPSPWDQGPASAPAVVLDEGVGLDLATVAEQSGLHSLVPESARPEAAPPGPQTEVEVWMEGARELFALGDFSGSLEMIEKILKVDPSHGEARAYLEQNEATLIAMYESKLGPSPAIPQLAIQPEEVMWLNLDHRAGFLLAQIDGTVSYEDLFALSGLPRLDTARILATLLQEGVIRS